MRPQDLTVVRFGYPGSPHNPALAHWLRHLAEQGYDVRDAHFDFRVDLVRNREAGRFIEESDADAILMIDGDMVPLDDTGAVLSAPGPLVFCRHVSQLGKEIEWQNQGIPTGCVRIARRVFERLDEPWFVYETDATIRLVTCCEAATFTKKCVAAGFNPKPAGRIGHLLRMVAMPPGPGHQAPEYDFEWKILHQKGLL